MGKYYVFGICLLVLNQTSFASQCAQIAYEDCDPRDTISGSDRYEIEVKNCILLEIRKFKSDYLCKAVGILSGTQSFPIDARWVESIKIEPESNDVFEYGTTKRRYRYLWNSDFSRLILETEFDKDLMVVDFSSSPRKYFAFQEKGSSFTTFSREGTEVVKRTEKKSARKSKHTRNEWLAEMKQEIEDYPGR